MPPTLYCQKCGYNLTGVCGDETLTGLCPQCGEGFEAEALRRAAEKAASIRGPLIVAVVCPPLAGLVAGVGINKLPLLLLVALLLLLVGAAAGARTADRIAKHMRNDGAGAGQDAGAVMLGVLVGVVLVGAQLVVAFAVFFFGCLYTLEWH